MQHKITREQVDSLRKAARMVVRELGLLNDAYFDIGVTLAERHLLIELETCLYPDVGDIAKKLLLDKSSASRLIAKAVKKGFVTYAIDESDKRRRCLQISPLGRETLEAFEPLAQKQVKDALLTLTEEEIQTVHQGIDLFAKGLSKARQRKEFVLEPISPQDNVSLANLAMEQEEHHGSDLKSLYEAHQPIGYAYFVIKKGTKIAGGAGIAPLQDVDGICEIHKMYLRADARGVGLDDLLVQVCLKEAERQGYHQCRIETKTSLMYTPELYLRHGFAPLANRKGSGSQAKGQSIYAKKISSKVKQ